MREAWGLLDIDRKKYATAMARNLPVLRAKLGLNQAELADLIGVTRQTISAMENGTRDISWSNFLSLLFLFTQNTETKELLSVLGIYTAELEQLYTFTDLKKLQ